MHLPLIQSRILLKLLVATLIYSTVVIVGVTMLQV